MKTTRTLVAFLLVTLALPAQVHADLVVVVNPENKTEQLTKTQIINIFLGNNREYPGGLPAKPIDLPANSTEKALFYRGLVNKDLDQMAAYWSRLVFAGNTSHPPLWPAARTSCRSLRQTGTRSAILNARASTPHA